MIEPLVEAKEVGMVYGHPAGQLLPVLSGIECRVNPGERIALIGPSGSGKSTLLHILSGLVQPTSGSVSWPALGARDQLMPEKVQTVFQAQSLFPSLDVLDNITLPLLLAGLDAHAQSQATHLLERFGLTDLAHKLPEELSGGQAQRVAMLRALATAPRLILADEPTGQLDTKTAEEFLSEVIRVVEEIGAALVLATHDPRVAARMDQQWAIDHGTLFRTPSRSAA